MRQIIPPTMLARQRSLNEASLTEAASVAVQGAYVDTGGGRGYYDSDTVTTYPCRRAPLGSSAVEQQIASQRQEVILERVYFAHGTVLRDKDKFEIDGVKYEVVANLPEKTFSAQKVIVAMQLIS